MFSQAETNNLKTGVLTGPPYPYYVNYNLRNTLFHGGRGVSDPLPPTEFRVGEEVLLQYQTEQIFAAKLGPVHLLIFSFTDI
jgi:hypothetical protein